MLPALPFPVEIMGLFIPKHDALDLPSWLTRAICVCVWGGTKQENLGDGTVYAKRIRFSQDAGIRKSLGWWEARKMQWEVLILLRNPSQECCKSLVTRAREILKHPWWLRRSGENFAHLSKISIPCNWVISLTRCILGWRRVGRGGWGCTLKVLTWRRTTLWAWVLRDRPGREVCSWRSLWRKQVGSRKITGIWAKGSNCKVRQRERCLKVEFRWFRYGWIRPEGKSEAHWYRKWERRDFNEV